MTAQDALLLLIIGDGEVAAETFLSKLISADYTAIGASITIDTVSPLSPPKVMIDVMISKSYRNT